MPGIVHPPENAASLREYIDLTMSHPRGSSKFVMLTSFFVAAEIKRKEDFDFNERHSINAISDKTWRTRTAQTANDLPFQSFEDAAGWRRRTGKGKPAGSFDL